MWVVVVSVSVVVSVGGDGECIGVGYLHDGYMYEYSTPLISEYLVSYVCVNVKITHYHVGKSQNSDLLLQAPWQQG